MPAVTFHFAGRRAAIAPVTTRTAKLIGIVNLQQFSVWMTDKRARKLNRASSLVHLAPDLTRLIFRGSRMPSVADFAAIDDVVLH